MARNRRASEPLQKTKKRIGGTSLTQGVKGGKTSATFAEDNTSVSDTIRTRESRHVLNSGPSSFDLGAPAMGEGEGQPALPVRGVPVLEPEAAQRRRARVLQGRIERVNREVIEGWVWDPQASNEPIRLELLNGEERLNVVVANEDRPYLVQLGCGDGRHGFTLRLDEALPSDGRHALTLRCADTGAVMPGSPIIVGHERTATADRSVTINQPRRDLCGYIDEISKDGVIGWVMMPDRPMHRCIVALKENGRIIARATASQFRLDVLSAGFGDGCYAFRLPLPPSLLDGQQHMLEIVEEETGITVTNELIRWNCEAGLDGLPARSSFRQSIGGDPAFLEVESRNRHVSMMDTDGSSLPSKARGSQPHLGTHLLFDVSDLVYYVGHHDNLTGIQRVQSSIILGLVDSGRLSSGFVNFISFNTATDNWNLIPAGYLISLLRDLFLPASQRSVNFAAEPARYGVLPGAQPFDGSGILDRGHPSVLCLLGAAWVQRDYCHRVVMLKRRFGTRFVMAVHDLIPIYARETCDQGTARVFEDFMRRALRHVDHVLAVSENTANDLRRYVNSLRLPEPLITVTKNGSSFAEFLPRGEQPGQLTLLNLPERFVLFVSTIEGRKNHQFVVEIWRRMIDDGDDPPHLICVGRLGWRASAFLSSLVETNYLDGRVHLLREVSDVDLRVLYERCLFTVFPSLYEGWGLPVGESLAIGKICVCSDRTSIREVACDCGVYIDIDNVDQSFEVIRNLIVDEALRVKLEAGIRRNYAPITWQSVAERVAAACETSIHMEWQEPYPYALLPYSTEISFGWLDRNVEGMGEQLLTDITRPRLGHFTYDLLDEQSFLLGEEIASAGAWGQPEPWGRWLCHSHGEVVFALADDPSQYYYVFLRLRVSQWMTDQVVQVRANGEKLWKNKVGPEPKNIVLRVRKRTSASGRWRLRIEYDIDLTLERRNEIAESDGRLPTIGFERLIVVPEYDLKTRLDILTKAKDLLC